jgi:TfoX/Sxy family transcriptional regulator of competence genes
VGMATLNRTDVLADRVRRLLTHRPVAAKRMFGGLTFMLSGNMLCCVSEKGLMVRVGAAAEAEALAKPHATPCLGAGRPMAGFIMVAPPGVAADADLEDWLGRALQYVETLPPKEAKPRKQRTA